MLASKILLSLHKTKMSNINGSVAGFTGIAGGMTANVPADVSTGPVTLPVGEIFVGNVSNVATARSVSGAAAISSAGVVTLPCAAANILLGDASNLAVAQALSGRATISNTGVVSFPLSSAQVLVGNGSNLAAPVTLSGDVTIDNAGVATVVSANVVTPTTLQAATNLTFISSTTTPAAINTWTTIWSQTPATNQTTFMDVKAILGQTTAAKVWHYEYRWNNTAGVIDVGAATIVIESGGGTYSASDMRVIASGATLLLQFYNTIAVQPIKWQITQLTQAF